MKKLLSLIMICLLLIGTVQTAMASESVPLSPLDGLKYLTEEASEEDLNGISTQSLPESGTITITGLKEGTTVQAYRLVELASTDGIHFSNVLNSKYNDLFQALGVNSASALAGKDGSTVLAKSQEIITAAENPVSADYSATAAAGENSVKIDVEYGFYYVAMTAGTQDYTIYNPLLVLVPQISEDEQTGEKVYTYDATAEAKSSTPGIEKKIVEGANRVDETTASVGDTIQYELTTPVPTYTADVDDSKVVFKITDTMSKGLTYSDGFAVYGVNAGGTETPLADVVIPDVSTDTESGITTIVMDFDYAAIKAYASLRITYNAELNEQAVIGAPGNPNNARLEYSHDTSVTDEDGKYPTKEPPEDTTVVYSFGLNITKYELGDTNVTLAGAEFSLKTADSKQVYFRVKDEANNIYTAIVADTQPEGTTATVTTIAGGKLIIEGLGAGSYTLTEVKAPDEYYIIEKDIPITITPAKDANGKMTGEVVQSETKIAEDAYGNNYFIKSIANSPEYVLPVTGGIGTVLFLFAAAMITTAACVMLYRRRSE